MRSLWQMWDSYMSAERCQSVIDQAITIPAMAGTTYGKVPNLRDSKVRWIHRGDTSWNWLFSDIEYVIRRANTAFGFDINLFHEVQFTEYDGGTGGHYGWHEDLNWVPAANQNTQRKLSFVMQLSDPADYEGGDLQFDIKGSSGGPNPEILKGRGTTIVFPSYIRHQVTPVIRGKRHSLVTWYEGPPFR